MAHINICGLMRMWEERHSCDDGSDGPSLDVVLVMEKIAKV